MRPGNRFASLFTLCLLALAALCDMGCQQGQGINISANGNQNGGQLSVSGPNFAANIAGGPNGGRVDIDAPGVSIHGSGAGRPRYYPPNPGYGRSYGPMSPNGATAQNGAQNGAGPQNVAGAGLNPSGINLPVEPSALPEPSYGPAAPGSTATDQQALTRFVGAQDQKDSGDPAARASADPISLEEAASEIAMLDMMSQVRRRNELGALSSDKTLDVVARRHSEEMASLGYFDHKSPVQKNKTLGDRFRNDGINFNHATENISRVPYKLAPSARLGETGRATAQTPQELARDMMDGYMNSPGHRAHILDPQVSKVGVATVIGSQYAYNTQNFKD